MSKKAVIAEIVGALRQATGALTIPIRPDWLADRLVNRNGMDVAEMNGGHKWLTHRALTVCENCHTVKRHHGENSPCRGKVAFDLRDQALAEIGTREPCGLSVGDIRDHPEIADEPGRIWIVERVKAAAPASEIIDRAAKALYVAWEQTTPEQAEGLWRIAAAPDREDGLAVELVEECRTMVRATLAAIREPTDEMVERGAKAYQALPGWEHETMIEASKCWDGMIDEALK
jgi:hypothetical protein